MLPDATSRVAIVSLNDGAKISELLGSEQEVYLPSVALTENRLVLAVRPLPQPEAAHLDAWSISETEP